MRHCSCVRRDYFPTNSSNQQTGQNGRDSREGLGEGGREGGQEVGVGEQAEDDGEEDDLKGGAKEGSGVDRDQGTEQEGGEKGGHYPCSEGGDGGHADAEGNVGVGEEGD